MTEPLTRGQKMFNQRLLAEHCWLDSDARSVWESLQEEGYEMGGLSMEESIASCNEQLKCAGLEIVAVSMPESSNDDDNGRKSSFTRYYAIVNSFPDNIAKVSFQNKFPPQQHAYVRLVFDKLVEMGPTPRSTVLNYKNLLNDGSGSAHVALSQAPVENSQEEDEEGVQTKVSLTLPTVEDILDQLLAEKWLVEQLGGKQRRGSNAALIAIGPRSYLELSYLLTDEFGMDKDDLPQQIRHRM